MTPNGDKSARILVTGSDGFVGRALCARLGADGVPLRCGLMDPLDRTEAHEPAAIEILSRFDCVTVGEIGPDTDWTAALDNVDAVIHLAARAHIMTEATDDPLSEYRHVNTEGTECLARAAAEAGVRRLVFASSIGVHGSVSGCAPFTEASPIAPDKDYAVSKWEAECRLRDVAEQTGLETVVVRPPLVYGPWVRGNFLRLLDWTYKGLPLPLGSVRNQRTFIGLDNLVDLLIRCIRAPEAAGETFVLGDDEDVSTPELVRQLARALDRPCRLIPCPTGSMRLAARLLGRGEDAERLFGSLVVDSTKIRRTLDWTPPVPLGEGIRRMCAWYLETIQPSGRRRHAHDTVAKDASAPPLITVVMATYVGDDLGHLKTGTASILSQTHANIEFLISLDGPVSGETQAFLTELCSQDSRVRILPQEMNRGPASARNAAFREAQGDYVAVFDADDVSAPNRLERQLAFLQETGADLVGSFMYYIDENDEIIGKKDMAITPEAVRRTAIIVNPINNPTAFAAASVFKDNPYDERFRRGQDYHLWARLIVLGYRLANCPEYLHSLRTGPTFFARRNRIYFWVSLRSRLILVKTCPFYLKPIALVLAVGLSSLRLLPGWALRIIYWFRNSLRAAGAGRTSEE